MLYLRIKFLPVNHFADVILPLPLNKYFTYRIPDEFLSGLHAGSRVIVPFGRKKFYTAIVVYIHQTAPVGYETKEIASVLDEKPILRRPQLKFWEWLASYYLCTVGEVYKAALPAGLKLESETQISINPAFEEEENNRLKERERIVLDTLAEKPRMTIQELEKESGLRNTVPVIKSLLSREALFVSEQLKNAFQPKTEIYVRLTFGPEQKEKLKPLFEQLSPAKKQLRLLMAYLDLSQFLQKGKWKEISRKTLLDRAGVSQATLNGLVTKGILETYPKEISRFTDARQEILPPRELNDMQQQTFHEICDAFRTKDITLLHGVTSSGKTEIYIRLIDEMLKLGRQVLYLVPEIALTTQLTVRLQRVFGNRLSIYHSKFSDNERVEIWNKMLGDEGPGVILGVRSSVFLPFRDLGLVIVDEEHENTYKQQDPAPRYHARNAAIVLASMHGAKTLLGTATPAIETYYNALQGKYGLVELGMRFDNLKLPLIIPADLHELRRKKQMSGYFSPLLVEKMEEALRQNEQVILFQNRRGYAPMVECKMCAWVPKCTHCDVSLTYHKSQHRLVCHYCGSTYEVPLHCPACGHTGVEVKGFGTERIEEEIARYFPEAAIARMDLDTTRTRKAYEQLIRDFQENKTHILIGTQMVTKGLDFDNVSVVGILSADLMMNYPDFRAHERAYQMMAQVAGRSGRKNKQGTVILQTSNPEHPLVRQVIDNDYTAMYETQLNERRLFNWPPFVRLIYIYLKHRDEQLLNELAARYGELLRAVFGERVLGPVLPPVARIQSLYIRKIVLKLEINASLPKVRELLSQLQEEMIRDERFKSVTLYYDMDPM